MDVILGVAIGLVLTIGIVAVVVSSVMELISAATRLRAAALEQGIARLLDNQLPAKRTRKLDIRRPLGDAPVTSAVMAHPLIRALSAARAADKPPSYIDAVTFATAFLGSCIGSVPLLVRFVADRDAVTREVKNFPAGEPGDTVRAAWDKSGKDPATLITLLLADDDQGVTGVAALLGNRIEVQERIDALSNAGDPAAATLAGAWQSAGDDVGRFVADLEQPDLLSRAIAGAGEVAKGIAEIKQTNPFLGKVLEDLWTRAGADFTRFRSEIEDWFDRQMARVSGWYSRWSQWIMVVIGLVTAAILNVSVVTVAWALWVDPELRAATEALAEKASSATGLESLTGVGLPIGWNAQAWPGLSGYLPLHLFGVVVTGIAASFGAPFWFDLLNRLVNLRAGGRPPATAAAQRTQGATT